MNFKSLLTGGVITGILAFLGTISVAIGKPAAGAFLSDPATAANIQHMIDGALALYAGFAQGVFGKAAPTPPTV